MIRPILQLGNEMLRKISVPVAVFHCKDLKSLIADLSDTLGDAKKRFGYGRGIAAPQISQLKRVIYVDMPRFKEALINPEITWASTGTFEVWDSCFSFNAEFFVLVDRHSSIRVDYFDQRGKGHRVEVMGALSELLQHEIDHLNGILATDRIKDAKAVMMRSEWEKHRT
jgi:peptide deformylase